MSSQVTPELEQRIQSILEADDDLPSRLQQATEEIARGFEARTCTLHEGDADERVLHLRGAVGLPEKLLPMTQKVPFGKGMAGICAERREPVTMCNLQTDDSGVARPAAKETKVAGALVVPLIDDGRVVGTLGVGKSADHDYSADEIRLLERCGEIITAALK